jgi:probable phosphoglycerate mutase
MAIILLIRHGENDWVGKRLAGHLPGVHLNPKGQEQAQELATKLQNLQFRAIYSSPLERAMETAQPLAAVTNLQIHSRQDLSEINFGDWQGKTIKQLQRLKLWKTVQKHPSQMQFPNGESFKSAQQRLVNCLEEISQNHEATDLIACFSHSDSIRLLVSYYLDMPLDSFQRINISTASISALAITKDQIYLPFINLIDINKFVAQFQEMQNSKSKMNNKTNTKGKK